MPPGLPRCPSGARGHDPDPGLPEGHLEAAPQGGPRPDQQDDQGPGDESPYAHSVDRVTPRETEQDLRLSVDPHVRGDHEGDHQGPHGPGIEVEVVVGEVPGLAAEVHEEQCEECSEDPAQRTAGDPEEVEGREGEEDHALPGRLVLSRGACTAFLNFKATFAQFRVAGAGSAGEATMIAHTSGTARRCSGRGLRFFLAIKKGTPHWVSRQEVEASACRVTSMSRVRSRVW